MKSKISLFNKAIVLSNLKRLSLISLVYTYILLFAAPMDILFKFDSNIKNLFANESNIHITIFLALIFPILTAISIFKYMHNKSSVNTFHSLPIKRGLLYRSNVLSGFILLTLPALIISIISIILNIITNSNSSYNLLDILQWFAFTSLVNFMTFLICSVTGMFVGRTSLQWIVTYILIILPRIFIGLLLANLSLLIKGYEKNAIITLEYFLDISKDVEKFIARLNTIGSLRAFVILTSTCVLLYLIGHVFYVKRKSEVAFKTFANSILRYIFKYFIIFCFALIFGLLIALNVGANNIFLFIGYILGSFAGYLITDLLLRQLSFSLKNFKGLVYYTVVAIVLISAVKIGTVRYESCLPELSEVDGIYFVEDYVPSYYHSTSSDYFDISEDTTYLYTDVEKMKTLAALHGILVKEEPSLIHRTKDGLRKFTFQYRLKDGSKVNRSYYTSVEPNSDGLKSFLQSLEYKKFRYAIFNLSAEDIEFISIHTYDTHRTHIKITDANHIKEAVSILIREVNDKKYDVNDPSKVGQGALRFIIYEDKRSKYLSLTSPNSIPLYMEWKSDYTNFEGWLKEKRYIEKQQ